MRQVYTNSQHVKEFIETLYPETEVKLVTDVEKAADCHLIIDSLAGELETLTKRAGNIRGGQWCMMADSCTACSAVQRGICSRISELEVRYFGRRKG